MFPSYIQLYKEGRLDSLKDELVGALEQCELCPRRCRVNRLEGEKGFCQTGRYALVSSIGAHFGEEQPLVGKGGSGTIFFTYCNLHCVYCQNYSISQLGEGEEVKPEVLAKMMLYLQKIGCENINFVTPTHVLAQIIEALPLAIEQGLCLPLVYNSGGYDNLETLRKIEGVFDIYMPDAKYASPEKGERYSSARDYWEICKQALKEMHRQKGVLWINERGIAQYGLLIRHLVLPGNTSDSFLILDFIAQELSPHSYVNVMAQYRPCFRAVNYPEINRLPTYKEYIEVKEYANRLGLRG
ncbi:MAG: radical SAM protein [Candidatus Omnitrophota bacterium]|nr:MAG: radical SAM protein [Candidatus Omnitrophota bacterium]